jgi:radical SAM superfamily enzyme YgiQ (UPF0313 family)
MNILLYDLGSNRKELNEPYGIESIAGNLKQEIKDVNIDFKWELLEPFDLNSISNNYDIIGISAKLGTLDALEKVVSFFTVERKSKRLIVGGPLSTFGYPQLLKKYDDLICVRGEGETSFVEICKEYKRGNWNADSIKNISNLAFKVENRIILTFRKVEELSQLNPPFRHYLNDIIKRKGIIRIENSRGCSWSNCDFCSVSEHYGIKCWRPFPIDFIINQMKELSDKGCLSPYFTDEDFFGGDYKRGILLAEAIIEEKKKGTINTAMNFFFCVRINDVLDKEGVHAIKKWKEAGLRELFVGLESGVQKQLKRYGKPATPIRNAEVIHILKELNIQLDIGYILFDPEMNFEELVENIQYIRMEKLSRHDSRSLKKIRAQPFTKTTQRYINKNIINGDLNLNLLFYPLAYEDEKVFHIMNLFSEWESKLSDKVYILQSECRGEVDSEKNRILRKNELSKIREFDYEVLLRILDYVIGKVDYSALIQFQEETIERKIKILSKIKIETTGHNIV